jgi:hypothetical protein
LLSAGWPRVLYLFTFPFRNWSGWTVTDAPTVQELGDYGTISFMTQPSFRIPHEQRKIERLLMALAKKKPVSAKSAPIANGLSATGTAHPRVFFST